MARTPTLQGCRWLVTPLISWTPLRLNLCSLVSVNNLPKSTPPYLTPLSLLETSAWYSMNISPFLTRSNLSPNPLLLPLLSASPHPFIPRYQNSSRHRHFHCSLQAWLLQLSLSQPAQVSYHPAPTDPELSCTWSNQIHITPVLRSLHLVKNKRAHRIQAPFTHLQSSHNNPTFTYITSSQFSLLAAFALRLWSQHLLVHLHHLLYE